jgi:L-rhamnose mutarotase
MEDQVEIPEHDKIDDELLNLIHALVGKEAEEEEIDAASNVLFSLIEQMVDDEEMDEIPEAEASDEEKTKWLETCLPKLKTSFEQVLNDLNSEEFLDMAGEDEEVEV